jgi:DNA segregation ATPase FtsK/SpoIIIE, S-DNA-T family
VCSKKCCPGQSAHRGVPLFLLVLIAAAVLAAPAAAVAVHVLATLLHLALFTVAVAVAIWLIVAVPRVKVTSAAAWRNYPRALLAAARWRWLARNLGLSYTDPHHHGGRKNTPAGDIKAKVRHPRARFRADAHGVIARVRTVPRSGRAEFEDVAPHIANEWRCRKVQVSQPKPGRLAVRGLVTDPLTLPLPQKNMDVAQVFRPYLGRDEWGTDRHADLSGITGISIAGLPGYGKTSLVLSLLCQLAATGAVQFVFIDGKGGGDYSPWVPRAWLHCGDDLGQAAGVLEDVHALMRARLSAIAAGDGPRNRWHVGPTQDYPLIVTVVDECHTFYDLEAVKGIREAESHVRACRALTGQLVKKGRSVLFVTILLTQKQTSDAIPTAIRDNCSLGFSFAVKTREAAVAGLGEAIRDYPSYCPTGLRERPAYVGVTTATLPSGSDPFVRLRVPEISEDAASDRARATACLRRDPLSTIEAITLDLDREQVADLR